MKINQKHTIRLQSDDIIQTRLLTVSQRQKRRQHKDVSSTRAILSFMVRMRCWEGLKTVCPISYIFWLCPLSLKLHVSCRPQHAVPLPHWPLKFRGMWLEKKKRGVICLSKRETRASCTFAFFFLREHWWRSWTIWYPKQAKTRS